MTASGMLWLSHEHGTVGLIVRNGMIVEWPKYAKHWVRQARGDARMLWRQQARRRGVILRWLPDVHVSGGPSVVDPPMDDLYGKPIVALVGTPDRPGTYRFARGQHTEECQTNRHRQLVGPEYDDEDRPQTLRELECICDRKTWELVPRGGSSPRDHA